ncbi:MAG: hypothetical protein IJ849_06975 [Selenomonadaceae bacterium]|nr:hypothetical protein [Selenomonadaceae bacterium]
MAATEEENEKESSGGFWHRHRYSLGTAAVFGCLCLISTGVYFWHQLTKPAPPPPPPKVEATVGLIDLKKVMAAHGDYEKLAQLKAQQQILRQEILDALQPIEPEPPQVEDKPFTDSVWQKNAQNILSQVAEIERLKKKAAIDYRKDTQQDYEKKRDEINALYLNAILNLQLKIQNADNMRLTAETVAELQNQLDALKQERNANQLTLYRAREQEIADYAEQAVAGRRAELHAQMESTTAALKAEAAQKQTEAQTRDMAALEERIKAIGEREKTRWQKQDELAAKEMEYAGVEGRIMNDIAGRAAKLAILHHYTMVLADPATNLESLIPWDKWQGARPEHFAPVIALDTVDITDSMIKEIRDLTQKEGSAE